MKDNLSTTEVAIGLFEWPAGTALWDAHGTVVHPSYTKDYMQRHPIPFKMACELMEKIGIDIPDNKIVYLLEPAPGPEAVEIAPSMRFMAHAICVYDGVGWLYAFQL